jgi:hypothetical protein
LTCVPIRLDRFSPFFQRSDEFGFTRTRPASAYFYVFPLGRQELLRLGYFFDYNYRDGRDPWTYMTGLQSEIMRWWELHRGGAERRPKLDAVSDGSVVEIVDTREAATAPKHRLSGLTARIYSACDRGQTARGLARLLGRDADESALRAELAALQDAKLLLQIGKRFLSLAVFRGRPEPQTTEADGVDTTVRQATYSE